jgi:hypothetical protein
MSFKSLFSVFAITAALATSSFVVAAGKHGHDHKPLHGGVVVEVKDMDYELVAKADVVQLYLRDHGKAVNINKSTAKVTFLTGAEKTEVELKPVGDKLEAKGAFKLPAGTKAVALVTVDGKQSSARFVLK